MCLAVPGKVISVEGTDPAFREGNVDFWGIRRTVNFAFTPDVAPGDFVLVHAGFAITRIEEEEAIHTYQCLVQIGLLEEQVVAPGLRRRKRTDCTTIRKSKQSRRPARLAPVSTGG
jgi:hydrogenase expression/formation protein HypC